MGANETEPTAGTIALLTDYGTGSVYVGALEGVIASLAPRARVLHVTHDVAPQDVREGAFLLATQARYYPERTIFVAVVDPGVGTSREIVLLEALGRTFIAPDNGLLSGILDITEQPGDPYAPPRGFLAREKKLFLPEVSATFHGRDIMAPLAARLAAHAVAAPALCGPPVPLHRLTRLAPAERKFWPDRAMEARVVHIDRFGNLVTDLLPPTGMRAVKGRVGAREVPHTARTYAEAPEGLPFLYVGSFGTLEVAVASASAEKALGARRGDPVLVTFQEIETA